MSALGDKPFLRKKALEGLRNNESQTSIAKRLGVSQPLISRLAKEEGFTNYESLPQGVRAKRDYDQANRIDALNEAFEVTRAILQEAKTATQVREGVTALAILVDKRRLEDGEATARSEVNTGEAKERLNVKLEQMSRQAGERQQAEQRTVN